MLSKQHSFCVTSRNESQFGIVERLLKFVDCGDKIGSEIT